jgi:hypothetical protein
VYKIVFFVPESHLEPVKQALFDAGAGKIGSYDCCAWQVKGQGQFRPLADSNAYIGEKNQLETLEEYRVELVCNKASIQLAIKALISAHPYETPAYEVLEVVDVFQNASE